MLHIFIGRSKTGKTQAVLEKIRALGDGGRQILLVPEHASHQAEVDLCRVCGDTASRHAEVLSFRRLGERVLSITGGAAQVTLDAADAAKSPLGGLAHADGVPPPLAEGGLFAAAAGFDRRAALL